MPESHTTLWDVFAATTISYADCKDDDAIHPHTCHNIDLALAAITVSELPAKARHRHVQTCVQTNQANGVNFEGIN